MAKVIRTRNAHQSHIVKLLNGMTGRFSLWNIWQDFITMAAVSISNVLQNPHSAEREKMYERCASKYSVQELTTFAEILAEVAQSMEEYPDQDYAERLNKDSEKIIYGKAEPYLFECEEGTPFQLMREGYYKTRKDEGFILSEIVSLKDSFNK